MPSSIGILRHSSSYFAKDISCRSSSEAAGSVKRNGFHLPSCMKHPQSVGPGCSPGTVNLLSSKTVFHKCQFQLPFGVQVEDCRTGKSDICVQENNGNLHWAKSFLYFRYVVSSVWGRKKKSAIFGTVI